MSTVSAEPPHAPRRGAAHRWLGSLHVTGVFWYRFHVWGIKVLPDFLVPFFMFLFTTFFFVVLRGIRRAIAANLSIVLGPCGWWERQRRVYLTLWNFAWCLSERYERASTTRETEVTVSGEENWPFPRSDGRGAILLTAHIGNWEVGATLVPAAEHRSVHVIREEEMDPRAQEFLSRLFANQAAASARKSSTVVMHFANNDPMLGPRLIQLLRQGELVAVMGDRPRARGRSVTVELFGHPVALPAGPAALARAAGVDVLPVFVFRRGRRRSHAVLRRPIQVSPPAISDTHLETADVVKIIAEEVEWAIRQEPFQWFCLRELWPGALYPP